LIKLHYSKEFDDLEVPEHVDKIGEVATIQVQFGGDVPLLSGKRRQEITMSWDLAMKLRWQHLLLQVQSSVFICILEVANTHLRGG
jgi:hypothetical protein